MRFGARTKCYKMFWKFSPKSTMQKNVQKEKLDVSSTINKWNICCAWNATAFYSGKCFEIEFKAPVNVTWSPFVNEINSMNNNLSARCFVRLSLVHFQCACSGHKANNKMWRKGWMNSFDAPFTLFENAV